MPTSNFQPIRLLDLVCCYKFTYLMANSADPDQLASSEANWSGSTLFAKQGISGFSRTRVKKKKSLNLKTLVELCSQRFDPQNQVYWIKWCCNVYFLCKVQHKVTPWSWPAAVFVHIFSQVTDNCPFWTSGRWRMTVKSISWSISMKVMWLSWDSNLRPLGL